VENKPASSFVVSLGKSLNEIAATFVWLLVRLVVIGDNMSQRLKTKGPFTVS